MHKQWRQIIETREIQTKFKSQFSKKKYICGNFDNEHQNFLPKYDFYKK